MSQRSFSHKMDTSEPAPQPDARRRVKITTPRYQEVARDVAGKIVDGFYKVGEKIYARSSLASQYGVSSETARRAVCVLDDLGIVVSSKGSGVTIISYEKAVAYVRQYREFTSINELRCALAESIGRQQEETRTINTLLDELVQKTERFRTSNPFVPFQTQVTAACPHLGKSLSDLNFWHNTLATVIAIRRGEKLILSPGPYVSLKENDVIFYIGDAECVDRVSALIGNAV